MKIRRFEAPTIQEALQKVRRELGSDAVIFQTRKYKKGGFLGLFGQDWAEITAGLDAAGSDRNQPTERIPPRSANPNDGPSSAALRGALFSSESSGSGLPGGRAPLVDEPGEFTPADLLAGIQRVTRNASHRSNGENLGRRTLESPTGPVVREFRPPPVEPAAPASPLSAYRQQAAVSGTPPATEEGASALEERVLGETARLRDVEKQIQELRDWVIQARSGSPPPPQDTATERPRGGELEGWERKLRRQGVEEETARRICDGVARQIRAGSAEVTGKSLEELVVDEIARLLRVAPPLKVVSDGHPRLLAFIGPTGVGKTTTIAKLGARYLLSEGKRVALITADTYRIAAVAQLRQYGEIMGIPVEVVNTPQELREALARQADKELLLLDTAGRSPQNAEQIQELREFFLAAQADEVHLVLSVTTRFSDVLDTIGKFGVIPVHRLLLTKLDETRAPGMIADLAAHFPIPVSWVTTGQGVPADIDPADRVRLARLVAVGASSPAALPDTPIPGGVPS